RPNVAPDGVPVICRRVLLVTRPSGLLNFGVFVTLAACTRSSSFRVPPIGKERKIPRSRFTPPGPRNWLRPVLPKRTPCGCAHADGSYQTPELPTSPTFRTSPTRSAVCMLPGVLSSVPLAVTVNGRPLNAPHTPL